VGLTPGEGALLHELWRSTSPMAKSGAIVREITLLVGAERTGLPQEIVDQADHLAHIPIRTDSLNAAMAATIALYELTTRMARDE